MFSSSLPWIFREVPEPRRNDFRVDASLGLSPTPTIKQAVNTYFWTANKHTTLSTGVT